MLYVLEYIWLDSENNFRSKTRVCYFNVDINDINVNNIPLWNYDGSSTGQAELKNSEIILKPTVMFRDPFRQNINNSFLVWCDMMDSNNTLLKNSKRQKALEIFEKYKEQEPWYGLEQEYFIIDPNTKLPLGFGINTYPEPQGKYYCGIGGYKEKERSLVEKHLQYCLFAGIQICGLNAEVAPGQWEYQIGPSIGIIAGDHLWISRYILVRVAETFSLDISFHPKVIPNNNWNGSGCHTNFSTKLMREDNGIDHINKAIKRLNINHTEHMLHYGDNNRMRLTGKNETSSYNNFTSGVAHRGTSIRIPQDTFKNKKGYFEDRRPASNCDPYLVTSLILETINNEKLDKYSMEYLGYII
jgi:glutamine synthetase